MENRHHTFADALNCFNSCHPSTKTIVDVGVQAITKPLLEVYPHCHHYLFEPVLSYHETIKANYANISYTLIPKAVSDRRDYLYQHVLCFDKSGQATHSTLSPNPSPDQAVQDFCLQTLKTEVVRLDQELANLIDHPRFSTIVKIDVDGLDSQVMLGMADVAHLCSLLIVECPINRIAERIDIASQLGFDVFDVTSPAYYHGTLSQLDFFFVNRDLKSYEPSFNPWSIYGPEVQWDHWQHFD